MDRTTREDFVEAAEDTAADIQDKFEKGKEAAKRYATKAKDIATDYAKQARDKTENQIKENPFWAMMLSLGVGLSIGLLVGSLAGRRSE